MKTLNDIAARSLGSSTSYAVYSDQFDSSLLNPMPRKIARDDWGIIGNEFVGYDVWHCHESTFLTNAGVPISGTLKFVYSCQSENMIESKSMKLYLNSFDMCHMGDSIEDSIKNYTNQIKSDLEKVLQTKVEVGFFSNSDQIKKKNLLENYYDVTDICDLNEMKIDDYHSKQNHIELKSSGGSISLFTNSLRSRCRHTKQKDSGTAAIKHVSEYAVMEPASIFKQIVSLREVDEFHEFCSEKLFIEMNKKINKNDDLLIMLLYSRRGSLDINPVRASSLSMLPQDFIDASVLTEKAMNQ